MPKYLATASKVGVQLQILVQNPQSLKIEIKNLGGGTVRILNETEADALTLV
jgi:hypothetical protein